ncbi:MAG: GDSL-type esterase/lipase family protein [Oscillospiraceae bacterium]|nr:GDSL-type esterase/lipase family protein [Oscillospiraceae bacterium]
MGYLKGNICVFGDSIVWGWGATNSGTTGWVNRLLSHVHNNIEGENVVYSLGVPGETTSGLRRRIEKESKSRNPQTIIIASGLNDCRYNEVVGKSAVELEKFEENVAEMIKIAQKFTKKIVCIGLTSVNEELTIPLIWHADEVQKNKYIRRYNERLQKICEDEDIKFISIIDLLSNDEIDGVDGIHPNSKGHEKLFEHILKQL